MIGTDLQFCQHMHARTREHRHQQPCNSSLLAAKLSVTRSSKIEAGAESCLPRQSAVEPTERICQELSTSAWCNVLTSVHLTHQQQLIMSPLPHDEGKAGAATATATAKVVDEWADCEVLELPHNVYACAFVLAQNATPGM